MSTDYVDHSSDPIIVSMQKHCDGGMENTDISLIPSGCRVPRCFLNHRQRLLDLEVREDDIWVASFPKCGTTWTQEMVWLLANNCDTKKARDIVLYERFPFLEFTAIALQDSSYNEDTIAIVTNNPSPRFIKTHLHEQDLPRDFWNKRPKTIYVTRDPKDVVLSYLNHYKIFNNFTGPDNDFIEAFLQDKVVYSSYWDHVMGYWRKRHEDNILIIKYEDMKKDLESVMRKVAEFLNVSLPEDKIPILLDHLSFNSMKNNPSVNYEEFLPNQNTQFMREGEAGSWKKKLTEEQVKRFNEWTEKYLEGKDFPYYKS